MEFFGCIFIAFGPPFSLLFFTIASDPIRVILLIFSSFFWLLSLLLSSLCLYTFRPLIDSLKLGIVVCVLFQELFRFLYYLTVRKFQGALRKMNSQPLVTDRRIISYGNLITASWLRLISETEVMLLPLPIPNKFNIIMTAMYSCIIAAGFGFGLMSGAFALINVLVDAVGPGTVGLRGGGDSQYFFVKSSVLTLCFILHHIAWGGIFFHALQYRVYSLLAYVVVSHLGASLMTLLNSQNLFWPSVLSNYSILLLSAGIAFRLSLIPPGGMPKSGVKSNTTEEVSSDKLQC